MIWIIQKKWKNNPIIQKNKLYLMYINNNQGGYEIKSSLYALRKIDTSGIIFNYEDAKVKDNETGFYVFIRNAVSSKLVNPYGFNEFITNIKNKFIEFVFGTIFNK